MSYQRKSFKSQIIQGYIHQPDEPIGWIQKFSWINV